MPAEQDFRDSDGDQVVNKDETEGIDKFIAKIIPLETVEVEMEFYTRSDKLKKYTFQLSNHFDLNTYSKDLLVKNPASIKIENHFSEFSTLNLQSKNQFTLPNEESFKVYLRFSTNRTNPQKVYLHKSGLKTLLGEWKPLMELKFTNEQLSEILSGESTFFLTFFESTEESIEKKTNRVFINDGTKTTGYYISKDLPLDEILKHFDIESYKSIEEQNLLTTVYETEIPHWWLRILNNNIIIVKAELGLLTEHYLKAFDKTTQKLKRINGISSPSIGLSKSSGGRALLKISGKKTHVSFKQEIREYRKGGGGKEGDHDACKDFYRIPLPEKETTIELKYLFDQLSFGNIGKVDQESLSIREISDGPETFWEIEVPAGPVQMNLILNNLQSQDYIPTGLYDSNCVPKKISLRTNEGRLELSIDVYIEKI